MPHNARLTLLLLALAPSLTAAAAGMTSHMWMSEGAIAHVEHPALKDLLEAHRGVVLSASTFPDWGMAARRLGAFRDSAISRAHGDAFIEAYLAYVKETFDAPYDAPEAGFVAAHFLGTAAHAFEDRVYDELFLREAFRRDFGANRSWGYDLDTAMDMILIMRHGRWICIPSYRAPAGHAARVFQRIGLDVTPLEILVGGAIHQAALLGERIAAPHIKIETLRIAPWASANVVDAAGGVRYIQPLLARYWESLWALLNDDAEGFRLFLGSRPRDGATLPAGACVTAVFSRALDRETVTADAFALTGPGGHAVPGAFRFMGGNVVSFLPASALEPGAPYACALSTRLCDASGAALRTPVVLSFTAAPVDRRGPAESPAP